MERTKEQGAPSVAALTLDLDACLAAVAERARIDEEERLQKEAARENERRLVEDAAPVVAGLVLARLPVALREPGDVVAVDVSDVFGDMTAERAPLVRGRAVALLQEYFMAPRTGAAWHFDDAWRFCAPALSLRLVVTRLAKQRDKARAHLAEVLGEGIPGLIDLHDDVRSAPSSRSALRALRLLLQRRSV